MIEKIIIGALAVWLVLIIVFILQPKETRQQLINESILGRFNK